MSWPICCSTFSLISWHYSYDERCLSVFPSIDYMKHAAWHQLHQLHYFLIRVFFEKEILTPVILNGSGQLMVLLILIHQNHVYTNRQETINRETQLLQNSKDTIICQINLVVKSESVWVWVWLHWQGCAHTS